MGNLQGSESSLLGNLRAAYVKCWMLFPKANGAEATWNSGLYPRGDE